MKVDFLGEETANHFLKSVMKTGLCLKTKVYPLLDGRGENALRLPVQWRHLSAKAGVILNFQTPTFICKGKIDMPLPVPVSVLVSILRSITAYSAISFPVDICEEKEMYVSVHRMQNINTMPVNISENTYRIGYIGQVEFRLHPKAPFYLGQVLSLLTAWGPFTGVGAKTAYGFGSVEVLEQWHDASVANG